MASVTIIGGGVAGLEGVLALRDLAGDRAELTLVSPGPDFVYRPLMVDEPFGLGPAEQRALAPIAEELGASFVTGSLTSVSPGDHTFELDDGSTHVYGKLLLAVGGRPEPAFSSAVTFPSKDGLDAAEVLSAAREAGGEVTFVVPTGVAWALPAYELALMTRRRAAEAGDDQPIRIVTPEEKPLAAFGAQASAAIAGLLEARQISFTGGAHVRESDGELAITPGGDPLNAGAVVALARIQGPAIEGIPCDENGFIPIDQHARVRDIDDVYAAGDGTNFPIKQGGIATQQADAAAAHIAHELGAAAEPEPFHPVLRGKLFTGDESVNMRADLTGGAGDSVVSPDYLWWPPGKISGRYLTGWLEGGGDPIDLEPSGRPLEVEVALPKEWHREPMSLDIHGPASD